MRLPSLLLTSLTTFMLFCLASNAAARADTVTYTFETPQFTFGLPPLPNRAPNSGLSTFRASFTSSPTDDAFEIDDLQPNDLFGGQFLFDPFTPADALTISFNMPVDRVQLDWAIVLPGRLELTSPGGSTRQSSAIVGGLFPGGTLVFSTSTPFNTFQLKALTTSGAPTLFAIDNLTLNSAQTAAVPEPTTMLLLGTGLGGIAGAVRRLRKRRVEV